MHVQHTEPSEKKAPGLIFEFLEDFQNFDFWRFWNEMGLETMKIELSIQNNADTAIQIEICL